MERIINRIYDEQRQRQDIMNNIRNGRIDIEGKPLKPSNSFDYYIQHPLFEEKTNLPNKYRAEAVGSIYEQNQVQSIFFSDKNIGLIQKLLAYHVSLQTEGNLKIGLQDVTQLKIVMKSVYLQYGKNRKNNVSDQVKELNAYVLDYCVPNIITNAKQYIKYSNDVSTLPIPIENPKYTSSAGTRTHPDYIF
jgi:hypothetical protein